MIRWIQHFGNGWRRWSWCFRPSFAKMLGSTPPLVSTCSGRMLLKVTRPPRESPVAYRKRWQSLLWRTLCIDCWRDLSWPSPWKAWVGLLKFGWTCWRIVPLGLTAWSGWKIGRHKVGFIGWHRLIHTNLTMLVLSLNLPPTKIGWSKCGEMFHHVEKPPYFEMFLNRSTYSPESRCNFHGQVMISLLIQLVRINDLKAWTHLALTATVLCILKGLPGPGRCINIDQSVSYSFMLHYAAFILPVFSKKFELTEDRILRYNALQYKTVCANSHRFADIQRGVLAWSTVLPDATGWMGCQRRLGPHGLMYFRKQNSQLAIDGAMQFETFFVSSIFVPYHLTHLKSYLYIRIICVN